MGALRYKVRSPGELGGCL